MTNNKIANCPQTIEFPGTYDDGQGHSGDVATVDIRAFTYCACLPEGKTKHVKLPKEVKVIRKFRFDRSYDLESFSIEESSRLEIIGYACISFVGDKRDNSKVFSLVLPHSLVYAEKGVFFDCARVDKIFYCGSIILYTITEMKAVPKIYVTRRYKHQFIFGNKVNDSKEAFEEADLACVGQTPVLKECGTAEAFQVGASITVFVLLIVGD